MTEIAHYTDANAILGILTGSGNENSLLLRATNIQFLNDAGEFAFARNIVLDWFCKDSNSSILTDAKSRGSILNVLSDEFDPGVFVTCFSKSLDLLSQWQMYSGDGSYMLVFDREEIEQFISASLNTSGAVVDIRDCDYVNYYEALSSTDVDSTFGEFFRSLATRLEKAQRQPTPADLFSLLWSIAPQLKDISFEREDEVRIVFFNIGGTHCHFDVKYANWNGMPRPYVPYEIPKTALKKNSRWPMPESTVGRPSA